MDKNAARIILASMLTSAFIIFMLHFAPNVLAGIAATLFVAFIIYLIRKAI